MTVGTVAITRATFFSTHHASAADALAGRECDFRAPTYSLLVGRARRFTSLVTQLHIEVCGALHDPGAARDDLPITVFATRHGEIQTAERLITDFREAAMVSSARFALSVHNTPSGVYAVAVGSNAPSTTITGSNAVAGGWLEAVLTVLERERPVLLSIADEPVPAALHDPAPPIGAAAAFLLAPVAAGGPRATLATLAIEPDDGDGEIDARRTLAAVAEGVAAAPIALGRIRPGARLALRLAGEAA
ncbi:MAG TPA: beta-ketoacyl synthase chain length factor [Kofleriaceae bacterium]|nr:beta-ketoacyl synthase chain length factor [Kofleriaceae bacterium]